jgi:hypothetical protein
MTWASRFQALWFQHLYLLGRSETPYSTPFTQSGIQRPFARDPKISTPMRQKQHPKVPQTLAQQYIEGSNERTAFEGIFQLARSHIRTDSFSILEAHRPKLDGFRNRDQ